MALFRRLTIKNWRQFRTADIEFHPRLTIVTGANGAGKSTIINILSLHFGFGRPFLSTPRRRKGGGIFYDTGLRSRTQTFGQDILEADLEDDVDLAESDYDASAARSTPMPGAFPPGIPPHMHPGLPGVFQQFGSLEYADGQKSRVGVQGPQAAAFGLVIEPMRPVAGIYISSHRSIAVYQPVQNVALASIEIGQAFHHYYGEIMNRNNGGASQFAPIYRMKEALIAMAAFGEGNSNLQPNESLLATYNGFVDVLRKVLPPDLGFQQLEIRLPDVVLKTRSGDFIIDSSSGGLNATLEIAWQIFLYSRFQNNFVVTIDEPENHLHPSMQRSILPSLLDAFPQAQFMVATHSPFVVSSVEHSSVYALRYVSVARRSRRDRLRRVVAEKLDQADKTGPAAEVLREVLGVPTTLPQWVEEKIKVLAGRLSGGDLTQEIVADLRNSLTAVGLEEYYPEALAAYVGRRDKTS